LYLVSNICVRKRNVTRVDALCSTGTASDIHRRLVKVYSIEGFGEQEPVRKSGSQRSSKTDVNEGSVNGIPCP